MNGYASATSFRLTGKRGTVNRDPETWGGMESYKVLLGHMWVTTHCHLPSWCLVVLGFEPLTFCGDRLLDHLTAVILTSSPLSSLFSTSLPLTSHFCSVCQSVHLKTQRIVATSCLDWCGWSKPSDSNCFTSVRFRLIIGPSNCRVVQIEITRKLVT